MSDIGCGDPVRVVKGILTLGGKEGEVVKVREEWPYTHAVELEGVDGRRWFSVGELEAI